MFLVNNKDILGQVHEKGLKFLSFYFEILKLKFEKRDYFSVEELKKNVTENGAFGDKQWVEEKIKELYGLRK
jgi:hypothetical protein